MMRLEEMDGMFVGALSPEELKALNEGIAAGRARRRYEGATGFMGLARVQLIEVQTDLRCPHCGAAEPYWSAAGQRQEGGG